MKFVILMSAITISIAQRPGYLSGGPVGSPGLASRFQTESPPSASGTQSIVNRVGENDASTSTQRIPIDARGDADLINRLNQWPRENRPFWVLNAEHIERHRNPQGQQIQGGVLTPQDLAALQNREDFDRNRSTARTIRLMETRGSFAGTSL